ncbi:hypothetical protein ABZU75_05195 [Streptosporangium sp. NPDC005286]|uniref:hypothetical protein n=1 Tax=Streptosporangium sp. NPDC005286 TaxID=3154463 RepID=UPI0033A45188
MTVARSVWGAFSVHPGLIGTELGRPLSREEKVAAGWTDEDGNWSSSFKTPGQGSDRYSWPRP